MPLALAPYSVERFGAICLALRDFVADHVRLFLLFRGYDPLPAPDFERTVTYKSLPPHARSTFVYALMVAVTTNATNGTSKQRPSFSKRQTHAQQCRQREVVNAP